MTVAIITLSAANSLCHSKINI